MAGGSAKVIIISLCANMGIAGAKLAASFYTGSAALMAESVHSFSDCGNQALLLYGGKAARRAVTPTHPLGYGREMFFWSFVVALLLFSMGGIFSIYEGLHKISHPEPLDAPFVGIAVLAFAIALESFSFWACIKEIRHVNTHPTLWQWVRKTTAADLLVIFLEDLAALLGLIFALAALLASWATGDGLWDGMGSCVIGVLLIAVAVVLAREVKSLLIGEAPAADYKASLRPLLEQAMPGARILTLIALQQGSDAVMLSYKIHPGTTDVTLGSAIERLNIFEGQVRKRHPEVKWQFAEFDTKD